MPPPDKIYHETVVRLCELAGERGVLENYEFRGCHIKGPAVLALQESSLIGNEIRGDMDTILWEIPPSRTHITGAILVKDCLFEECIFDMVGFTGPPDFIQQFRGGPRG